MARRGVRLQHEGRGSAQSGENEPMVEEGTGFPRLRRVPDAGNNPSEGEEGFLSGNPPGGRIRDVGANGSY